MGEKGPATVVLPCHECRTKTKHRVVAEFKREYWDEHHDIGSFHTWQLLQCGGCDYAVTYRHESVCTEDCYPDGTVDTRIEAVYPGDLKRLPKEFEGLPDKLNRIYDETIRAINGNTFTLAAAGLRALVEGICLQLNVTRGPVAGGGLRTNLEGKINGLREGGHLTAAHAETLHQLRFMGNEAVHELDEVAEGEAILALDIIEHMLDGIFCIAGKGELLKAMRAIRKSRGGSSR